MIRTDLPFFFSKNEIRELVPQPGDTARCGSCVHALCMKVVLFSYLSIFLFCYLFILSVMLSVFDHASHGLQASAENNKKC